VTQIRQERVYVTPKNHARREVNIDWRTLSPSVPGARFRSPRRLRWGEPYRGAEDLVFTWDDGRPVLPDDVTRAFAAMNQRLGPAWPLHPADL
jgi:integrase